jgi:hypothetical protein
VSAAAGEKKQHARPFLQQVAFFLCVPSCMLAHRGTFPRICSADTVELPTRHLTLSTTSLKGDLGPACFIHKLTPLCAVLSIVPRACAPCRAVLCCPVLSRAMLCHAVLRSVTLLSWTLSKYQRRGRRGGLSYRWCVQFNQHTCLISKIVQLTNGCAQDYSTAIQYSATYVCLRRTAVRCSTADECLRSAAVQCS